ncbi:inverse autotransporter beta domain-containing protein, partial [Candidatus Pantoea multigeneris]
MSLSHNTHSRGRYSARMRRFALLQAALQVSIALTPAWAITAVAQQTPPPSELHDYLNPAAQLAQSGNFGGFAAQQASGMASQQLQQWLQNFGTARVEFGINSKFAPQAGSVDLLLPLYDSPDRLFFTQNGIRLNDGQATGNFGLGQRHFIDDWMVG